ncbi:MAG: methyltransferase domain-containing protein [Microthrixaceae bacterium]
MSAPSPTTVLRSTDGDVLPLDVEAWRRSADALEIELLEDLTAPVIDVGCGPGRIVEAVASSGRMAMGVDTSPAASAEAGRRGAPVLTRSIFDPLPGERRWGSVVVLDGNIGIGGDPHALLRRAHDLLAPSGTVIVEVGAPGTESDRLTVRVERGRSLRAVVSLGPGVRRPHRALPHPRRVAPRRRRVPRASVVRHGSAAGVRSPS